MTWQIHNVDCFEFLKSLPDGSVDAVVTDPPWNLDFFNDDSKSWPDYAKWLGVVRDECVRVSTRGVWIFQSTKSLPHVASLFDGWGFFASAKNFCQMTKKKVPNAWDWAAFLDRGFYKGNGRNYHVGNTAGMLKHRTAHPTPRPLDTMEYILGMFEWESILDPFAGSGTTGVACVKTGRNFIGCEIDAGYCEIARRRCKEAEESIGVFQ